MLVAYTPSSSTLRGCLYGRVQEGRRKERGHHRASSLLLPSASLTDKVSSPSSILLYLLSLHFLLHPSSISISSRNSSENKQSLPVSHRHPSAAPSVSPPFPSQTINLALSSLSSLQSRTLTFFVLFFPISVPIWVSPSDSRTPVPQTYRVFRPFDRQHSPSLPTLSRRLPNLLLPPKARRSSPRSCSASFRSLSRRRLSSSTSISSIRSTSLT